MFQVFIIVMKILIGFFGILFLMRYGGGMGYAVGLALGSLTAYTNKESLLFSEYKEIKNPTNPLYRAGCYREIPDGKRKSRYWSDFKLVYWIQVYGCVQAVIFLLYGIFTIFVRRYWLAEYMMASMVFAQLLVSSAVQIYYEETLEKALRKQSGLRVKRPGKVEEVRERSEESYLWKPFKSEARLETTIPISIETAYRTFSDLENKLGSRLEDSGYKLFKPYSMGKGKSAFLYYKETPEEIYVFLLQEEWERVRDEKLQELAWRAFVKKEIAASVFSQAMESMRPERAVDRMLEDFFLGKLGTVKLDKGVFLIWLTCQGDTGHYRGSVRYAITQARGQYWIEARLLLDTGILYLARQKKRYGREQYEKVKEELLYLLGQDKC